MVGMLIIDAAVISAISLKAIIEAFGGSVNRPYSEMLWMFFVASLIFGISITWSAWRGYVAQKKAKAKAMAKAAQETVEFIDTLLKAMEEDAKKSEPKPSEN